MVPPASPEHVDQGGVAEHQPNARIRSIPTRSAQSEAAEVLIVKLQIPRSRSLGIEHEVSEEADPGVESSRREIIFCFPRNKHQYGMVSAGFPKLSHSIDESLRDITKFPVSFIKAYAT